MVKITIQERFRRADTGVYCTEEYAKKHPKSTVREVRKIAK